MQNILGIIVSYVFIAIIIISAKFFVKDKSEASRKYIHILLCNWWFIAMYFFDHPIWASFVPFTFIIINYLSYKKNLIDVMEREQQDGLGTVYYAISLFVLVIYSFGIIHNPAVGLIGILVMGYGDGLAAVIGQTIPSRKYQIGDAKKSVAGSLTMFVISFIIISLFLVSNNVEFWQIKAILLSVVITILEAVSIKGTDNIVVPILTSLFLTFLL